MKVHRTLKFIAFCGLVLSMQLGHAQWRAQVLPSPKGGGNTYATALDQQYIVGRETVGLASRAIVWLNNGSSVAYLDQAGAENSAAAGVENGRIYGWVEIGGTRYAVVWPSPKSTWESLSPGGLSSVIYGVGGGQQVGSSGGGATLWTGNKGSWISLHPSGATISYAAGADGKQQVGAVDRRAYLWQGTATSGIDLTPPNFDISAAYGVAGGYQVGYVKRGVDEHACLWRGSTNTFVNLSPSRFVQSYAFCTDGNFQAGTARHDFVLNRACIWKGTFQSYEDIHAYLPTGFRTPSEASAIVSVGAETRIVGSCRDSKGVTRAVLWVSESVELRVPLAFTVAQGTYGTGNMISLRRSDDDWLVVTPAQVGSDKIVDLAYETIAPPGIGKRFGFMADAHVDAHSREDRYYLFDFATQQWILMRTFVEFNRLTDLPGRVETNEAERFIEPSTRRIRARVVYINQAGSNDPWRAWVDKVEWSFPR